MKLSLTLFLATAGLLLIYSGFKDTKPQDILAQAFGGVAPPVKDTVKDSVKKVNTDVTKRARKANKSKTRSRPSGEPWSNA